MVSGSDLIRTPLLAAARRPGLRRVVERAPISRSVVRRFVAGESTDDAVRATRGLANDGLLVTLDRLGEDTLSRADAEATAVAYVELLDRLADAGLADRAEASVKLSAIGQALDPGLALANAQQICETADRVGTTVTLDMEDHTTTDATLDALGKLRADFSWVGAVVQSYLHRTEADCRDLATTGSRVRLCKGAYAEPPSVAFQRKAEVDASYRRCLQVLMEGPGYPMIATHDPALVHAAIETAGAAGRDTGSYELQMLHGVRPDEQRRLAREGSQMRVYLPYGTEWYGYLMRRMAERPANVGFFLRALATRG